MVYGYLGPAGTFTEMALRQWLGTHDISPEDQPGGESLTRPFASVDLALAAVRSGELEAAMVPIENSVEGGVTSTLDNLAHGDPLVVTGEVLVPITFVLAAPAGTRLEDVERIGTHSHAWAQVRGWVAAHKPDVAYVPTMSTAAAAAALAPDAEEPASHDAAICALVAAERAGLTILASDIGDNRAAVTRFALVARPGALPEPTGADKTTVVLFQKLDQPGGLLSLLEQFAVRGVNLTRLESRPTGEGMGQYCFSIDIDGHVAEARVAESLVGLKRVCADVRFLGSYPKADLMPGPLDAGTEDEDFREAWAWMHELLGESPA